MRHRCDMKPYIKRRVEYAIIKHRTQSHHHKCALQNQFKQSVRIHQYVSGTTLRHPKARQRRKLRNQPFLRHTKSRVALSHPDGNHLTNTVSDKWPQKRVADETKTWHQTATTTTVPNHAQHEELRNRTDHAARCRHELPELCMVP